MSPTWTAEYVVDATQAARLIATQFPQLAPVRAVAYGEGFDNTAFLVNDVWVFRFPRRTVAVPPIEAERAALPVIAGLLPLVTPVPEFCGQPSDAYAWPFLGYRELPGHPACRAPLTPEQRAAAAAPLARFLRALHGQPPEVVARAGVGPDPCRRMVLDVMLPRARASFAQLAADRLIPSDAPYRALLDRVPPDWTPADTVLVHGDFYACHVLVDDTGTPTGVIDWGDVHRGDPAVDLFVVYGFLPPAARDAFWQHYGEVDAPRRRVAQARAASHASMLARYAHDLRDQRLLDDTLETLRRAAED